MSANNNEAMGLTPEQLAHLRNHYASLATQGFASPMLAMQGQAMAHQQFNPTFAQQFQAAAQMIYPHQAAQALALQNAQAAQAAQVQSVAQPQAIRQPPYPYPVPNGVHQPQHQNANQQQIAQQQAIQRNQHHQRRGSHQHQQQSENSQQISLTFTTTQGTTNLKVPKNTRAPFPPPNPHIAQLILQNSLQQYLLNNPHMARRIEITGVEEEMLFFHPAAMVSILNNVLEEMEALFRSWATLHGYPSVLYSVPFMSPTTPQMRQETENFIRRIMVADELLRRDYSGQRDDAEIPINGQKPQTNPPVINGQQPEAQVNMAANGPDDNEHEGRLVIASPECRDNTSPVRQKIIRDIINGTKSTAALQMPKGVKRINEGTKEDSDEIKRACLGAAQQISLLESKIAEERNRYFNFNIPPGYLEAGPSSRPTDYAYYAQQQEAANAAAKLREAAEASSNASNTLVSSQRQLNTSIATSASQVNPTSCITMGLQAANSGSNEAAGINLNEQGNVATTKQSPVSKTDHVPALVSIVAALETNKIAQQARQSKEGENKDASLANNLGMCLNGVVGSNIIYRPLEASKQVPSRTAAEVTAAEALAKMTTEKKIKTSSARDYNTGPYAFPMGGSMTTGGKNGQKYHKCNVACPPNCPGKNPQ